MIIGDYHTHTTYCDGDNTPEEMLLTAIDKGLKYYGFSSHSHLFFDEDWNMSLDSQKQYVSEILSLKEKYKDKITVLLGTEYDLLSDNDLTPFEYVIGSCHSIIKDGNYISVDHSEKTFIECTEKFYGGDYYEFIRAYYSLMASAAEKKEFTFYGHFDLITKYNKNGKFFDDTSPEYLNPMYKALEILAKSGKPFELNTAATYRHSDTEPTKSAVKWLSALSELGGKIIINSDSHRAHRIGFNFEAAERLAALCGFKSRLILTPSGFEEIRI